MGVRREPEDSAHPRAHDSANDSVARGSRDRIVDVPQPGHAPREIRLAKRLLSDTEIAELENRGMKPAWAGATIAQEKAASRIDRFTISVPAPFWGVHRVAQ